MPARARATRDVAGSPPASRPTRRADTTPAAGLVLGAGALLLLTLAAYAPVLHAGFIWDDNHHVTHNALLTTWDGLRRIWLAPGAMLQYYPLTHTTFWLQYRAWGLHPLGYHLVNVVGHGLNACILWLVLRRLALPGAWVAAAVFALHPVHVESVAWVTELKNVQSGFFYLLAALALLGVEAAAQPRRAYARGLSAYVAAVLSKTVTCTLPVALLPCLWWKRGRIERTELLRLLPLVAVGIPLGGLTVWMERRYVGAQGVEWSLGLVDRCLIAGRALWFYAGKLLVPIDLTFVYPRWEIDPSAGWQYLFPLGAAGVVVVLWALRARLGRGPLAGVLFFLITLGPALGFFDVYPMLYSFVADHYQYLASIGLIAVAVGATATGTARWRSTRHGAWVAGAAVAVLLASLGALTWRQVGVYRDLETLWRDTLRKNPAAWMAHNNLGLLLLETGRTGEAGQHFRQALSLRPRFTEALYNLGNVAVAEHRLDEAADFYEQAIETAPLFAPAHNNLGNVYAYQRRFAEAIAHYERALELLPDYPDARANLEAVRAQAAAAGTPSP